MFSVNRFLYDLRLVVSLPQVKVHLMRSIALDNDPFFVRMVDRFYKDAMRRHPKFPFIRNLQFGVALSEMPASSEQYMAKIPASGRGNVKKALRNGYVFSKINYNDWLMDIADVQCSTMRRRPNSENLLTKEIPAIYDPASRDSRHDYIYFGIIRNGKLCAYSGYMVSGELLAVGDLFGHNEHMSDGVVPLLLVMTVDYIRRHHPSVRYYMCDKYFGAGETMRRFKVKFNFKPHRVTWVLE